MLIDPPHQNAFQARKQCFYGKQIIFSYHYLSVSRTHSRKAGFVAAIQAANEKSMFPTTTLSIAKLSCSVLLKMKGSRN